VGLSQNNTLSVKTLSSPEVVVAGLPFSIQPTVAVVDGSGEIVEDFVGDCYVGLASSGDLFLGECDVNGCGTAVFGTITATPFVKGVAYFSVSIVSLICFIWLGFNNKNGRLQLSTNLYR
jgi:hypothetical protein